MRTILLVMALAAPPVATMVGAEAWERWRYPRRFAEAIPNEVYRGGFPSAEDIAHLKEDKAIRTIVSLTDPKDRAEERQLTDQAARLGIRRLQFPMPGDGRGDYAQLDLAADAIADGGNRPLFFHCAAGKQRSNAAWAAYRMKHCGWNLERALAELERDYDLDRDAERLLCQHLAGYERRLVAQTRLTTTRSTSEGK